MQGRNPRCCSRHLSCCRRRPRRRPWCRWPPPARSRANRSSRPRLPGDPRVFVVEREGGVRIVEDGALLQTPFLTVENVDTDVERGLLSIAFPPDYTTSGLFYVFTVAAGPDELEPSANAGQIRIVEYHRSADPNVAEPGLGAAGVQHGTQRRQPQRRPDHVRARRPPLRDPGRQRQQRKCPGSRVGNFFGKILRIDPGDPPGEATYSVPDSNPIFPEDLKTAIYSIGLRNPYRASFGPSGELIVADVGNGTWEEIDVGGPTGTPAATTLAGANLGWPDCEGFCPSPPPKPGLTEPVFEYPHEGPSNETTGCAVLGGYVVRDPSLTGLTGRYLYGDLCRSDLRTLSLGVPGADPQPAGISIPVRRSARVRRRLARLRLRRDDGERLPGGAVRRTPAPPVRRHPPMHRGPGVVPARAAGSASDWRERSISDCVAMSPSRSPAAMSANSPLTARFGSTGGRRHPRSAPPTTAARAVQVTSSARVCPPATPAPRSSSI